MLQSTPMTCPGPLACCTSRHENPRARRGIRASAARCIILQKLLGLALVELAAMAEALVNLTKFRRRVTMERETVGGPIDVVVITKGDGFVWIRRKHYFASEYNPRVIARYAQGG